MDKLLRFVKDNLSVSDAELEFTAEQMDKYRCPLFVANGSLYDRIIDLVDEYYADADLVPILDDNDFEHIFYNL